MKKKLLFVFSFVVFIVAFLCFFSFNVANNSINEKKDVEDKLIDYSTLSLPLTKDNFTLFINGNLCNMSAPIYIDKNRYYICLNEFIEKNNGSIKRKNCETFIKLLDFDFSIDINTYTCNINNSSYKLKGFIPVNEDLYYISFSDLSYILNLYTSWDRSNKIIYCKTNGYSTEDIPKYKSTINQIGLIRLEDVTTDCATEGFSKSLEALRIMGKYLACRNIPYHIAWIPRFVSPSQNVDINLIESNSFGNAEMVYTLDFLCNNNGVIGLHGYTHQTNNEVSGIGGEFGFYNTSASNFRERINKAIETANYLNIPIGFFETPHYAITEEQTKIAEEYFHILYYPYELSGPNNTDLSKPQLSPYNSSSYYISTPLNYIKSDSIDSSINNILKCNTKNLGSIFFHPYLEYDFINTYVENNIPMYTYDPNSTLKKVVKALETKGFKLSKVTDF